MIQKTLEKARERGIYLLVVDSTEEFSVAIDHACLFAAAHDGHVALLSTMEMGHVENWQGIEQRMREESRAQSEQMIWDAAKRVMARSGEIPMVCIEEGDRIDVILKTIKDNPNISALILGASTSSSSPGPLVSYFSGKGLSKLPVPLIIVPGNLEPLPLEE